MKWSKFVVFMVFIVQYNIQQFGHSGIWSLGGVKITDAPFPGLGRSRPISSHAEIVEQFCLAISYFAKGNQFPATKYFEKRMLNNDNLNQLRYGLSWYLVRSLASLGNPHQTEIRRYWAEMKMRTKYLEWGPKGIPWKLKWKMIYGQSLRQDFLRRLGVTIPSDTF